MTRLLLATCLWLAAAPGYGAPTAPEEPRYSATALYNLGNSFARAGKPGLAVLNYQRAALLAPADPDIAANLDYVRRSAHLPAAQSGAGSSAPSRLRTLSTRLIRAVSPAAAFWVGVAGIILLGIGATVLGTSSVTGTGLPLVGPPARRRRARRSLMAIGLVLVGLPVAQATMLWPTLHAAVVVTPDTPVRVSPVPMGDPVFNLAEADTVTLTAEHDDFVLIRTAAGRSGWVARANVVPVVANRSRIGLW